LSKGVFLCQKEKLDEVKDLLNLKNKQMEKHLDILIKYKFLDEPEESYEYRGYISNFNQVDGWPMWKDIKEYCKKKSIVLYSVVYDLNFKLLD